MVPLMAWVMTLALQSGHDFFDPGWLDWDYDLLILTAIYVAINAYVCVIAQGRFVRSMRNARTLEKQYRDGRFGVLALVIGGAVFGLATYAIHDRAAAAQDLIVGRARVVDGDTIVIGSVHLRLQGLDAEETFMTNGPKAKEAMQDIVGDQIVTCKPDGTRSVRAHRRDSAICRRH